MKSLKFTLLAATLLLLLFPGAANAQTDMSKWSIGIFPGILQYSNDDGNEFFSIGEASVAIDLGVGRRLSSSFDVEAHFMGANLDWMGIDSSGQEFETEVFDLGAQLVYKFANGYILKEDARLAPFLFAGVNAMRSNYGVGADFPLGGGLNLRIDDLFSMQLRSAFKPTTQDEFNMVQTSLGFVWHIGEKGETPAPDRDGDGIVDVDDRCPDVYGIAENMGCPEIDVETREIMSAALRGIKFEFEKATIKPESEPILNRVVDIMKRHPEYRLFIKGHTDSKGSDEFNMQLSKDRAASAKQYLIDNGIESYRLQSEGYGETRPVATNDTDEGRALNRRVEFTVFF